MGLGVVDAVEKKRNPLAARRFSLEMENETVQRIFNQRPQEQADQESSRYMPEKTISRADKEGAVKEEDNHRRPDDQYGYGTDVRKEFQKIRFE